ncbi:MAG: phosphotransferase, partial [candidate division Zixibacteria bacterium]|nr:phosphotransferase [candidate division Zixibacteria bacterium]
MIPIRPRRPQFDSEAAEKLLSELYGLSGVVEELPSERDRNYRITTQTGVGYVLKIANVNEAGTNLEFQNEMLDRIAKSDISSYFPTVVHSQSGQMMQTTEGRDQEQHWVRLLTFLDGQPLSQIKNRAPELISSVGDLLGR